ncbi:hypothetical protein, unlikely [Trypanosoma brucei gambiense DAL972]|uniref:Uncharacterized protein n=1 Tax=Trypanosoma brucei gambiense (strain MHOM/CI/86/DAL972) TaxID=679716 RepID=C9ZTE8_TRYB9|nr:hypothetical protein, unlikely [Trypanosoma brucei gambiense DAL972]CBH12683.1 hypothetical protein, unlikely [Trypanosoma brucei gambiense DAL972]|eukprot:XP_011774963.1 hypothetical protein, unlikely [Trypanosoma brucei gambiense DAL972]
MVFEGRIYTISYFFACARVFLFTLIFFPLLSIFSLYHFSHTRSTISPYALPIVSVFFEGTTPFINIFAAFVLYYFSFPLSLTHAHTRPTGTRLFCLPLLVVYVCLLLRECFTSLVLTTSFRNGEGEGRGGSKVNRYNV